MRQGMSLHMPFYGNTPDGMHCVQASLRMMLKYFEPEVDYDWPTLDKITAKQPGMSTWKSAMWLWLANHGYDLQIIDPFDAPRFVREGGAYLRAEFGEGPAGWMVRHSDIPKEQRHYQQVLDELTVVQRVPQIDDIYAMLRDGYVPSVSVNSKKLAGLEGYVGHQVIVVGCDDATITLHNPGLPPQEAQQVSHVDFEAAWASPNEQHKELFAIKPQ